MYQSGYLKQHQLEYYRRLSMIREEGDFEGWMNFFLEGVATAAADAERNIITITIWSFGLSQPRHLIWTCEQHTLNTLLSGCPTIIGPGSLLRGLSERGPYYFCTLDRKKRIGALLSTKFGGAGGIHLRLWRQPSLEIFSWTYSPAKHLHMHPASYRH
jgi:hypothetical protein